ncbi:peptidase domain-containing ABC transporter [Salmonella enterica subsp. enterica serovar Monophasic]|nr:peptidase domain-containing ABC transporter [Salmonella enterica subsp. enterica serovar Monophasic]
MISGLFKKKVKPVLQNEEAECGQACLTMIFNFYGYGITLPELRQSTSGAQGGITLGQMEDICSLHGFRATSLTLEYDELAHLVLPCILHWDFTHFVVLTRVTASGVGILDPAFGAVTMSKEKCRKHFTGIAMEISRGEIFTPVKKETISLKEVTGKVFGFIPFVIKTVFISVLLDGIALLLPRFSQIILDKVVVDKDKHFLLICVLISFCLLLLQLVFFILNGWMKVRFDARFRTQWRNNIFSKMLNLPVNFFTSRGFGSIMYRFKSVDVIQNYLTDKFSSLILNGISAFIIVVVMSFYNLWLTTISLLSIILYAFVRVSTYHYLRNNALGMITLKSKEQSVLINALKFIQLHKLYSGVDRGVTQYAGIVSEEASVNARTGLINVLGSGINQWLSGLRGLLILAVGALLVMDNKMTIGMIFAFTAYSVEFSKRAVLVIDILWQIQLIRVHALRLSEITRRPEEHGMQGSAALPALSSVTLRNIYHQYGDNGRYTLANVSIDIKHHETIVLTGSSGSGKSTLIKMILGLTEPVAGTISVGGVDIRALGKHRLREMVSTVLQGDTLFPGSIYENITFENGTEHLERIQQMATSVGVHHVISALPLGYFTMVGDMSDFLSGGEKQKILVMRALFKNPRILILDEADSHLDAASEKAVFDTVMGYPCTKIIISHKTERTYPSDRVICLNKGGLHSSRMA